MQCRMRPDHRAHSRAVNHCAGNDLLPAGFQAADSIRIQRHLGHGSFKHGPEFRLGPEQIGEDLLQLGRGIRQHINLAHAQLAFAGRQRVKAFAYFAHQPAIQEGRIRDFGI